MRRFFIYCLVMQIIFVFSPQCYGALLLEAHAFQDEEYEYGPDNFDQISILSSVDDSWAPYWTNPITGNEYDYFLNGNAHDWIDALSLVFDPEGLNLTNLTLRVYLQKGNYGSYGTTYHKEFEHYQVLPGEYNPMNEDGDIIVNPVPGVIDYYPDGQLPDNYTVGWVNMPFDATSDPGFVLLDGNIALTLRLWNWRVDAVELVPEPSTLLLLGLGGLVLRKKK